MGRYGLSYDSIETAAEVRQLAAFMEAMVGEYPAERHVQWVNDTCIPAIRREERSAEGWRQDGRLIGAAVLKPIGVDHAELKFFRMAPGVEGRGMGAVMLKSVLQCGAITMLEAQGLISPTANEITVTLDTKAGGQAAWFFEKYGFDKVGEAALYEPDRQEVIMQTKVELI
jgi:N-acetylglutamate synthase-like GNAT family acetyltransferase